MDLYPTLVELAGFEKPDHLDGQSLLAQINNPDTKTSPVISSYKFTWTEHPVIGHAVRSERYRYIYYPEIGLEELYDHTIDPNEWDNVAYRVGNKKIVSVHRNILQGMLPELQWKDGDPKGYEVDTDGSIRKIDFTSFQ